LATMMCGMVHAPDMSHARERCVEELRRLFPRGIGLPAEDSATSRGESLRRLERIFGRACDFAPFVIKFLVALEGLDAQESG
jgi:hypothetical protein